MNTTMIRTAFYGIIGFLRLSFMKTLLLIPTGLIIMFYSCSGNTTPIEAFHKQNIPVRDTVYPKQNKKGIKTIHVFVALCDNKYQGIVPVGKSIGNGQDATNNLYWGCEYGMFAYFKKKDSDWELVERRKKINDIVLERVLFKHKTENIYLLADAYDGRFIKETIVDFLSAASGKNAGLFHYNNDSLFFGGSSSVVSYIGHDGLMDFSIPLQQKNHDSSAKSAIILSCFSKRYFMPHLKQTNAQPLLWTTGLMAPEAYTLHDALRLWIKNKSGREIQEAAARAYAKYQKCSFNAASKLLVSGW